MPTIRAGLIKRISVNGALLREARTGRRAVKPFNLQTSSGIKIAKRITICGPSALVFKPAARLKSGAVAWVETRAEVRYE